MILAEASSAIPLSLRRNLLLHSLSREDSHLLAPHLSRVSFAPGDVVASPGLPLTRVLFPETMVVSFREDGAGDPHPMIGMVGSEGMIGWPILLGCTSSPLVGAAQLRGGNALAICGIRLREACRESDTLNHALLRFVHLLILQMACTSASHACDAMERRVARWLLMLHDRVDGDALGLTHDHISVALNVRRASITDCLHRLEGERILKCTRGSIVVRDRVGLERTASRSYGQSELQYTAQIAPFGKHVGDQPAATIPVYG